MFSRRHPYLFFLIIISSIAGLTTVLVTLFIAVAFQTDDYEGLNGDGEKVGVVEITGLISEPKRIIRDIKRFRKDDSVKAIVIRIDSPGGVIAPTQEIYREIIKARATKKVVASMGAVAASGGYYIAAAADGIMANPGTITGSIGVIFGYTNLEELFKKIGLRAVVIKSGEYKDMGSPTREMRPGERRILQEFVERSHKQFIVDIAKGRKMDLSRVTDLADGRIFTGQEAQALGLLDRLGNLEDAIEWAGRLGGIEGDVIGVYPKDKAYPFLKYLLHSAVQSLVTHAFDRNWQAAYLFHPWEPRDDVDGSVLEK